MEKPQFFGFEVAEVGVLREISLVPSEKHLTRPKAQTFFDVKACPVCKAHPAFADDFGFPGVHAAFFEWAIASLDHFSQH